MPNGDSEIIDGIAKSAECGHEVEITLSKICNKSVTNLKQGPLSVREDLIFIPHSLFRAGKGQSPKNFLTRTADVRVAF